VPRDDGASARYHESVLERRRCCGTQTNWSKTRARTGFYIVDGEKVDKAKARGDVQGLGTRPDDRCSLIPPKSEGKRKRGLSSNPGASALCLHFIAAFVFYSSSDSNTGA